MANSKSPKYGLPACWQGVPKSVYENRRGKLVEVITQHIQADIQAGCKCKTPQQAFQCKEGHLAECHVGHTCEEARCSHFLRRVGGPSETKKKTK